MVAYLRHRQQPDNLHDRQIVAIRFIARHIQLDPENNKKHVGRQDNAYRVPLGLVQFIILLGQVLKWKRVMQQSDELHDER